MLSFSIICLILQQRSTLRDLGKKTFAEWKSRRVHANSITSSPVITGNPIQPVVESLLDTLVMKSPECNLGKLPSERVDFVGSTSMQQGSADTPMVEMLLKQVMETS